MGLGPHDRTATHVHDGPSEPRIVAYWDGGTLTCPLPALGTLTLGRSESCDVSIDHVSVSRVHARMNVGKTGALTIEDLGSSNGTQLNGRPLEPHRPADFRAGDAVRIGAITVIVGGIDVAPTPPPSVAPPRGTGNAPVAVDARSRAVFDLVRTAAGGKISVLVLGETGVGKEVVAETLHQASPRASGPFTRINCAAIPENLFESTLFGNEKGAFTGAASSREGALEATDGGTLFLDEVGEIPLQCQAKLLRAIETGEVVRVGGFRTRKVDVRFVAATNRNLEEVAATGRFRQDLYYRLNGITVVVPPLRERPGDIPALVDCFLDQFSQGVRPELGDAVLTRLLGHSWPGNVRELRHVVERAILLAKGGPIGLAHLPDALRGEGVRTLPPPATTSLRNDLDAIERERIQDALTRCGGNQTQAAKLLGMPRRTLVSRIEAYGLPRPRKGDS